jgi:pre-mRNA cleavage complex 2 protein Pcf11
MSAGSPRLSLSGASSAEVADDFGESLKDLQVNNKYEINNLMIIAKENTEHAQAISRTLENHIKTVSDAGHVMHLDPLLRINWRSNN